MPITEQQTTKVTKTPKTKTARTAKVSNSTAKTTVETQIELLEKRCAALEKTNADLSNQLKSSGNSKSSAGYVTQDQWKALKKALRDCSNTGLIAEQI